MPGIWNPFPIETDNPDAAIFLIAWEMTKLALHNREEAYTADDVRVEYATNYQAIYAARAEAQAATPTRVAKRG